MFVAFGENFQLGVDCVAALSDQRYIIFGWHMTPAGIPVELSFTTLDGRFGRIEYVSRHDRPDVVPDDPGAAAVRGFNVVVAVGGRARNLILTIGCGDVSGRANLSDSSVNTDLFRAMAERDWGTTFSLLRECGQRRDVLPLLTYQYRPFGAFATWIARLPMIEGSGEGIGIVARADVSSSPAGEIAIDLRFTGRSRATVAVDVVAIGKLQSDDGGPDQIEPLLLLDPLLRHTPGASVFYARIDWDHVVKLRGLDVIVQITFDEERVWLRCQPRIDTVPSFLDLIGAAPAGHPKQAFLREVLDERRENFRGLMASRGAPTTGALRVAEPQPASASALALIGIDSRDVLRLIYLLAPELETYASTIVLVGAEAAAAAQIFARRGKVEVQTGQDIGDILEHAGQDAALELIALDLPRLARAVIEGDVRTVILRARMGPNDLAGILLLHMYAGLSKVLGDTFTRRTQMTDNPANFWEPVNRNWDNVFGGELINEHLEEIWQLQPGPSSVADKPRPAERMRAELIAPETGE